MSVPLMVKCGWGWMQANRRLAGIRTGPPGTMRGRKLPVDREKVSSRALQGWLRVWSWGRSLFSPYSRCWSRQVCVPVALPPGTRPWRRRSSQTPVEPTSAGRIRAATTWAAVAPQR